MTIFGHPFAEVRKFVLALVLFIGTGLVFILHYKAGLAVDLEVLAGSFLAVIGVFAAPQFSEQDFSKAITAAIGALFTVLQFFVKVNPSTELEVYTLIGMAVSIYAIWRIDNNGHRTKLTPARRGPMS